MSKSDFYDAGSTIGSDPPAGKTTVFDLHNKIAGMPTRGILRGTTKAVLRTLALAQGNNGKAWVGNESLQKTHAASKSTIARALHNLAALGLIIRSQERYRVFTVVDEDAIDAWIAASDDDTELATKINGLKREYKGPEPSKGKMYDDDEDGPEVCFHPDGMPDSEEDTPEHWILVHSLHFALGSLVSMAHKGPEWANSFKNLLASYSMDQIEECIRLATVTETEWRTLIESSTDCVAVVASLLDDPRFNADCRERAAESEAERSKFDEMLEASAQKWAAKSPLQKVLGWAESVMHYFEEEQDEMLPLIREEQRKELARIKGLNAAVPQAAPPVIPITPVPPKPKLLEFNFDENEVAA